GYALDRNYVVRPLMFEVEELDALALGAQMVESWGDKSLAKAARKAVDKITTVLPETLHGEIMETTMFSFPSRAKPTITVDFTALRRAIRTKNFVEFHYTREDGKKSRREVRPLCLVFFGPVWLLLGWCETRKDFRNFRLDRMRKLLIKDELFRNERGKRLSDYIKLIKQEKPDNMPVP
ncbi:MAG: WYL domain-containing protein, partial [Gammaproteobacteria bacterium]|nr:WYL domain-containing protein [Gammaproteobacteria bacterium]